MPEITEITLSEKKRGREKLIYRAKSSFSRGKNSSRLAESLRLTLRTGQLSARITGVLGGLMAKTFVAIRAIECKEQ